MKVKISRESEELTSEYLTVEIGNNRFRLSESVDGRLVLNKISIDGSDDYMRIFPRTGNEIEIS